VGHAEEVHQREVDLNTVQRWIAVGHIRSVRLPGDYRDRSEDEITRLLTRMFEVPAQLEEVSIAPAPPRRGDAVRPEEWGPAF
jgi:hypothetical protein